MSRFLQQLMRFGIKEDTPEYNEIINTPLDGPYVGPDYVITGYIKDS